MRRLLPQILSMLVIVSVSCPSGADAQYRASISEPIPISAPPAVLYPEPTYWFLGLLGGVDINSHTGDFITFTCDRTFEEAEGEGIYFGAQLEHRMSENLSWVVRLAYNDYSAEASFVVQNVPTRFEVIENGNTTYFIENVDHTYSSAVKLSYLSINPMIEFFPFGGLYLFAGPAVGILVNGQYNCLDFIADDIEFVRDSQTTTPEDDVDIPNAESLRIDLRAGIGYNLRLGRSVAVAPELGYNYALTKISNDDDWGANALTAIVVLKIDL